MTRDCIVVTGASRGIGAAIAIALAKRGHDVACLSRSATLPAHADVSPEVTARWSAWQVDVSEPASLAEAFRRIAADGRRISGLVNNAGLHVDAPSAEMPLEQWHRVIDMNATSVVTASQAAVGAIPIANPSTRWHNDVNRFVYE